MTYSLHTLNNDRRADSPDGDLKPTGLRRFAQEIALADAAGAEILRQIGDVGFPVVLFKAHESPPMG